MLPARVDSLSKDIKVIRDIRTAAQLIVSLSYGDRAAAAMLFDVARRGRRDVEHAYLGGSRIWRVKHKVDRQYGKPRKQLMTKKLIAKILYQNGLIHFDGEIITPKAKEIHLYMHSTSDERVIGPATRQIYDFLRAIIPKATSRDKKKKAVSYITSHRQNYRIILPSRSVA